MHYGNQISGSWISNSNASLYCGENQVQSIVPVIHMQQVRNMLTFFDKSVRTDSADWQSGDDTDNAAEYNQQYTFHWNKYEGKVCLEYITGWLLASQDANVLIT